MSTHNNNNYDIEDTRFGTSFGYQSSDDDKPKDMFTRKVKVIEIERFRDGGTIHYQDQTGENYYVDNRIGTKTPGRITDDYPDKKPTIQKIVELEVVTDFNNIATLD
jgi:hypothetical protein